MVQLRVLDCIKLPLFNISNPDSRRVKIKFLKTKFSKTLFKDKIELILKFFVRIKIFLKKSYVAGRLSASGGQRVSSWEQAVRLFLMFYIKLVILY